MKLRHVLLIATILAGAYFFRARSETFAERRTRLRSLRDFIRTGELTDPRFSADAKLRKALKTTETKWGRVQATTVLLEEFSTLHTMVGLRLETTRERGRCTETISSPTSGKLYNYRAECRPFRP